MIQRAWRAVSGRFDTLSLEDGYMLMR
jgi:hypothetical protein